MKMYKKEIDEIYELCKRVANEVPTANASFNYSIYGMSVCGLRRKEDVSLPEDKFKWDLYQSVSFNPFYEKESRKKLNEIKTFLLELLIDGRCPLNAESDRTKAPADNGTDSDSERASEGVEQAESVHS
jgi:hypothetical protein